MTNQRLVYAAPDQPKYNRLVMAEGTRQRLAFSPFETTPLRRGAAKAVKNIEGGGVAWESAALPGFKIYEAEKVDYVNFGRQFKPLERFSRISTYAMIDGRVGLDFDIGSYDPAAELSVDLRDSKTSPALNRYGYSRALVDSHRFGSDGLLDRGAHLDMIRQLPFIASGSQPPYELQNYQDIDPFLWHHPIAPVDPVAPGYVVCDVYGDVAASFRSFRVDDKHGEAFGRLARNFLGDAGVAKIARMREIVARLERPPAALWAGEDPIVARWVSAVADGVPVDGMFPVPNPIEGLELPYGYTTIAGVRALAVKHDSGAADWSDEARSMFKIANEAWPHFVRLWSLIRRVYPRCTLVENGRFVPAWMRTESDDTNAFYSVASNFFDSRVRYPVWSVGGDENSAFGIAHLRPLGIDGANSDARLDALNAGFVDDSISAKARSPEGAADMREAYRLYVGTWYQRMIEEDAPGSDREIETFFAREVDRAGLTPEQRGRIAAGILSLVYEATFAKEGTQVINRTLINSWRNRTDGARALPPVAEARNGRNSRLSFHPSVWRTDAARAVASVAPADPTQRDRPLPVGGYEFARGGMPAADPIGTRSGMDVERPRAQDLGSLDELDEDQMLYPLLYQKDQGVFWKFRESAGTHEMTYYLWARVNHLREIEPDPYDKLGVLCMLFSRISIPADEACVRAGIPPPDLCFMLIHYAVRQRTQGVIIAAGNGAAGLMYYGKLNVMVGADVKTKEWSSNFDAWLGAGITDPRAVLFQRDVFSAGGLTGYDTSAVPRDFEMTHAGLDKAMIVAYVGSEFTRNRARAEANPFALRGRYDHDYLGSISFDADTERRTSDPSNGPFPGWFWIAALHKVDRMHETNKWSYQNVATEMQQRRYVPGIAFMEEHVTYSGERKFETRHGGTGHTRPWPDNIRDVSEGTQVFYPTEIKI